MDLDEKTIDLDLRELNEWLGQFLNFERTPDAKMLKLETMRLLCQGFGHPERSCPCFHVAGSKGKGTIAANIAAILRGAGYQTGVYASPHISHFVERVSTGEGPFAPEIYQAAFSELKEGIHDLVARKVLTYSQLTWFEMVTLFSMLVFRKAKVDFAIYEVGMGGRLDATNVVTPVCCCFGLIELEHTQILGDTLEKIAYEKAGIIKPGVPAVSVPQALEVRRVLEEIGKKRNATIDFCPDERLSLDEKREFLRNESNQLGVTEQDVINAAAYLEQDLWVAKTAVLKVLPELPPEVFEIKPVALPARFEKVFDVPGFSNLQMILIDGAHTVKSVAAVLERIKSENTFSKAELLFACAKDKQVEKIAEEIVQSGLFSRYFLTRPSDFKPADLPRTKEAFKKALVKYYWSNLENNCIGGKNLDSEKYYDETSDESLVVANEDFREIIRESLLSADKYQSSLVVLGSFYLAGEVKRYLKELT